MIKNVTKIQLSFQKSERRRKYNRFFSKIRKAKRRLLKVVYRRRLKHQISLILLLKAFMKRWVMKQ